MNERIATRRRRKLLFSAVSAWLVTSLCSTVAWSQDLIEEPGSLARGEAGPELSVSRALTLAAGQDPSLKSVVIERQRANLLIDLEKNRYVPLLTAEGGYRAGQTAQASPLGTQLIASRALSSNVALQYTLPYGTTIGAALRFERAVQDSVIFGDIGTRYGTNLSLDLAQPWLRGFGEKIGRSGLRDAMYAYEIASLDELTRANQLASDVLGAYWNLWALEAQQDVVRATLELQSESLEMARVRAEVGVASRSDVLRLEADMAQAREELLTLSGRIATQQIELSRVTGQIDTHDTWRTSRAVPAQDPLPDEAQLLEQVLDNSPDARRLAQLITRSELQAMLARDQARPDLQTIASLSVNGVGETLDESFGQFGRFEAVVGYVGVRVSLPLVREGLEAQADRATLAIERAKNDLIQAQQRLQAQARSSYKQWEIARERIVLATQAVEIARETVEIEQTRYQAGDATSLEVTQALTRFTQAGQRVVTARRDAELARIELMRLTGTLIDEIALEE